MNRAMTTRSTVTTSADLYPIPHEPEVTRLIFNRVRRDRDPETGKMIIEQPLSADERHMIDQRLQTLAGPLAPAKRREIAAVIAQNFTGLGGEKIGSDEELAAIVTQYVKVMEGLPLFAVTRACLRFARGEVTADELGEKELRKGMRPPTSFLRIVAEKIARSYWDEASLGSMLLHAKIAPSAPSEEQMARRAEKAKAVIAEVAKRNAEVALRDAESDAAMRDAATARRLDRDRQEKIAEYENAGLDPVYADDDKTIVCSLPMMLHMGWRIGEIDGRKALLARGDMR